MSRALQIAIEHRNNKPIKVETKLYRIAGLLILFIFGLHAYAQPDPSNTLSRLLERDHRKVFVAAHRGDWRDAPENSIQSLQYAEKLGADIVEMDLKKTRDGQLVVMHDKTLDRTTTGSGAVADHSLAEVESLSLRAGTGHPTAYKVPTFAQELAAANQSVVLDIDQAWNYFPDVLRQLRASGAVDKVIFNVTPDVALEEFERRQGAIPDELMVMIVVNMDRPDAEQVIQSYGAHKRTIVQCIFKDDKLPSVKRMPAYQKRFPIWVNSLWPDQNGGHDDELATTGGKEDESWGWLIANGADILQTDRPRELLDYLRRKGRR